MAEYFSLQSALAAVTLITALVTLLFIIPYRGGRTRCASIEVINMRVIIGAFLTVVETILCASEMTSDHGDLFHFPLMI